MNIDKRWMVSAAVPLAIGLTVPAVAQAQEVRSSTAAIQQAQQPVTPGYPFTAPGCNNYIDPWEDSVPEGGQPHYDRLDDWCDGLQGGEPEGNEDPSENGDGTIHMN